MTPAVRTTQLSKRYRSVTALDSVTADIPKNTITGLLGRNGAGKTTFLQLLTGHIFPTSGSVEVLGEDPYENASVLARVCLVREAQRYPDGYRVHHVLQAARLLYDGWDDGFADDLIRDFDLPPKRPMKKLSRGMLSAVGAIVGLASRAPVTMFDEPYLGLDAVARHLFYDRLLADYAENPRTVVLSTHLIDEVSDLIEHVLLIDRGRVLLDSDAESLQQHAVAVVGPTQVVDDFVADQVVLNREQLGGTVRATVTGASRERAVALGLAVDPVSLQELVIRATTYAARSDRDSELELAGRELS